MLEEYEIIRSNRKTIAIQIKSDGHVIVRCPNSMRAQDIRLFVESKENWIRKHISRLRTENYRKFTAEEIARLRDRTKTLVRERAAFYAPMIGVSYHRISVRVQHTRWGSCSGKGNLNFNALLALLPPRVVDYVVVHELCHLKQMNHSSRFWAEVESILPDYKNLKRWLNENGHAIIAGIE